MAGSEVTADLLNDYLAQASKDTLRFYYMWLG